MYILSCAVIYKRRWCHKQEGSLTQGEMFFPTLIVCLDLGQDGYPSDVNSCPSTRAPSASTKLEEAVILCFFTIKCSIRMLDEDAVSSIWLQFRGTSFKLAFWFWLWLLNSFGGKEDKK